jgi:integrase
MRLIDRTIRALKPPTSGQAIHYDETVPGFGLRITASDTRAFILDYRADGRTRRYTIGRWGEWSATAARNEALTLRQRISAGEDPAAAKQQRVKDPTVAEVAKAYLEQHASKKRSGEKDRAYLEKDVLPRWGSIKARAITRADVLRLIDQKAATAPTAANRLLAVVRKMFNWAIERGILDATPCVMVKMPTKERRKDRVLTAAEIATVWTGMDSVTGVSEALRSILRVILVTAQRPGEVAQMEWSEIDGDWWTIPAAKAKNGVSHRVSLNTVAKAIIDAQPRTGAFVFTPKMDRPVQVNALAHAVRRAGGFGVPNWTPHDLRRTAASGMAGAGVDRVVIAKILNHSDASVTAIYDRFGYDPQKTKALEAWGRKLKNMIGQREPVAANVVEFPA